MRVSVRERERAAQGPAGMSRRGAALGPGPGRRPAAEPAGRLPGPGGLTGGAVAHTCVRVRTHTRTNTHKLTRAKKRAHTQTPPPPGACAPTNTHTHTHTQVLELICGACGPAEVQRLCSALTLVILPLSVSLRAVNGVIPNNLCLSFSLLDNLSLSRSLARSLAHFLSICSINPSAPSPPLCLPAKRACAHA